MNASISNIFHLLHRDESPADRLHARIRASREDVQNALPGCSATRIAQAQARAERHVRAGMPVGKAVERVVAWARCATDPTTPSAA